MDIHQLHIFVDVVERGSFAAVARRLNLAPSMVTRAVGALEAELGVRLFHRTTRQLVLTDVGVLYHEKVCRALTELTTAGEDARDSTGVARGKVRLTASVAFGLRKVLPILSSLNERHPSLVLDAMFTDSVIDLLATRVDIALRLGPPPDSSLVGFELLSVRFRVCASPDYVKRYGTPRSPTDLFGHMCIRFPLPGFDSIWKFRRDRGPIQEVPVAGWLYLSSAIAVHQAAVDGLGPALLADWLIEPDVRSGHLIDLFPEYDVSATNFDSSIWLLYASRAHLPLRTRVVIDHLKSHLGKS